MNRIKNIFVSAGKALAVIIAALILLEGLLFALSKIAFCPFLYDARYYRYLGRPHGLEYDFRINGRGFKDREFSDEKRQGVFRIVATGDSTLWGVVPRQHNFLTILEQMLNRDGAELELYNMGLPAIGPHDYRAILAHEAVRVDPDMFLLCFYIGDDFGTRKLYTYSRVASLVRYIMDLIKGPRKILPHEGVRVFREDLFQIEDGLYYGYAAKKARLYRRHRSERVVHDYHTTLWYLREIRDICRRKGISLVVAVIPDELQMNKELQGEFFRRIPENMHGDVDFLYPNRLLNGDLEKMGITHFDITDDFIRAAESSNRYFFLKKNYHWNIDGNRVAAEFMFKHLEPIIKEIRGRKGSQNR
ncbi:MAG: hypothetical protein JXA20_13465 [Spirochaetes bacterium]|nr:hypothetical protein [Spirochaetota bacterium]